MSTLTLAALLHLPMLVTANPESYAEARRMTEQTGRPLVVVVGAEWCPACQVMKKEVLPLVRARGVLGKVAFAQVDLDRDGTVGQQLVNGGMIPQLIMFRKTRDGWMRRRLIGRQSPSAVESFIQEGIALSQPPAPPAQASATPAEQPKSATASAPATSRVRPVSASVPSR